MISMEPDRVDGNEKISLICQLVDLATSLRQERLFVVSEQNHLQELNEQASNLWNDLTKMVWVTRQQRVCVNKLAVSHCDYSPASCGNSITILTNTVFVEARKILSYQSYRHCVQLLSFIKRRPQILAHCLTVANQSQSEFLTEVIESIILGLYGCCLLPVDRASILELLLHLTHLQLVTAEDPLRLLRHGSCAFARLYSLFNEGLYSATLFLTAALHSPIMNLIMEDEKFLDIDPDKALIRFTASESLRMFGSETSPEYLIKLQKYREWTVAKLVSVTNKFIESIRSHIHCFPSSICWLVRHVYRYLANARKLQEKQIFALCVDLVVTSFICPAIVNPEPYGIIDAPLSYIARFNLIQVANILQMLAMKKYEPVDPKVADLFIHFDDNCLTSIINVLLEDVNGKNELDKEPIITDNNEQLKQMSHNATAYFTEQQLHNLIIFLQSSLDSEIISIKEKSRFQELLGLVASDLSPTPFVNGCNTNSKTSSDNESISPVSVAKRQINLLSKAVTKTRISATAVLSGHSDNNEVDQHNSLYVSNINSKSLERVFVFVLEDDSEANFLGLLTEEQVLHGDKSSIIENSVCDTLLNVNNCVGSSASQVKMSSTCCSSQDGEAGSDAGSNQSEDSSIDIEGEDQNDNLSDMISANVSGRGSPNISGRDTPSSQIMENENEEANAMEPVNPPPTQQKSKQPRFDLDDKFGKFEIKNLPRSGDETISMTSDTWSTDVLASDSENVEHSLTVNASNISSVLNSSGALAMFQNANFPQLIDISETASEGWSTDVVVSDSDRVTEVDTDDTASVARSDITTRSEVESRGEEQESEANVDDLPVPVSGPTLCSMTRSPHSSFKKKETDRSSGSRADLPASASGVSSTSATAENESTRRNFLSILSQSSSSSPSRSSFSHQTSMDSEDLKIVSGETNISMSSAASVSSSCSSAGNADGENILSKRFSFSEITVNSASHVSTNTTLTHVTSSSVSISNGCAIAPVNEKTHRSSSVAKSISFDKTAEKGDKDEDRGKFRNVLKNFRFPQFSKNRRGRDGTPWGESTSESSSIQFNARKAQEAQCRSKLNRSDSGNNHKPTVVSGPSSSDLSEDILAKYRLKNNNAYSNANTASHSPSVAEVDAAQLCQEGVDSLNINCEKFKFENAKKKLRSVLSNSEILQLPCTNTALQSLMNMWCQHQNVLVAFLQLQLAEAIHLKDRSLNAHLLETVRCVKAFDDQKCLMLFDNLRKEYSARSPYLSYLMRSRQTLLSIVAHLNRIIKRVKCEQVVCKTFYAAICTRLFLQKREHLLLNFAAEFHSANLADEKNDVLQSFRSFLESQIDSDITWQGISTEQLEAIKVTIERAVISRVYMYAMFPNGDGDLSRDEVLFQHIKKLSKIITPNHKYLCIPKKYHYECPWPAAQQELIAMSAYKTPAEKLGCILRCTQTIQNLLCLACNNSVPSADNLVPILVYVIIMANPPSLLSTIQYINSFYGTRLQGEEQYWWIQFSSAVEFIKTMDYGA